MDGEVASVPDAADTGIGLEDTGDSPGDGETPPDPERTDDDLDGYTEAEETAMTTTTVFGWACRTAATASTTTATTRSMRTRARRTLRAQ